MIISPEFQRNVDYFPSNGRSLDSISVDGAKGIGAEPSPKNTITPFVVLVGEPLTALMAPASIKLAKAPINTFFTARISFDELRNIEQTTGRAMRPDFNMFLKHSDAGA
jgi:hypothetical protein